MKINIPRFELTRVYSDGTSEKPEIIPVGQIPCNTKFDRRGLLGVGVGIASLLLVLDGKATAQVTPSTPNQTDNVPVKVPDKVIKAHKGTVHEVVFSPVGKIVASGSSDNTIKLWSLPDGKLLTTLEGNKYSVNALAISPDGKILASGSGDSSNSSDGKIIKLWTLPDGKPRTNLKGGNKYSSVKALVISPDGKNLISGSFDETSSSDGKTIKLWSLPDGKLLATFEEHKYSVNALAISPDGKILASDSYGDYDETIKLWSLADGKLLASLKGHKYSVRKLAISPDGKILASGSSDNSIKLWSLPDGKLLATLEGHKYSVRELAISPDGKVLASGSDDNTIKLWSLPDGKPLATLEGHEGFVSALAISPDGKTLASGDSSGVIILWDLEKRSFLSFLFDPKANQTDAISYNIYDNITGRTLTFTLPCGSPIPLGAVCTCNCVPGTFKPPTPSGGGGGGGGTYCTCVPVCTCNTVPSDREVKESFETTDATAILQKLSELPIQKWNYEWDDESIRHIGPMAQDFASGFCGWR